MRDQISQPYSGSLLNRSPHSTAQAKKIKNLSFFSKCSENSKNFKEYYSKVTDHEYLVSSAILYRYCGEIAGWAVGRLSGVSG
jgi:F0F1-type ATP synthase delta subunit